MAVGPGRHCPKRDTLGLNDGGALAALLATVDWAARGGVAAAGGFGDAPVDGEVIKLQADHAVVGLQHQQLQGGEDAQADPVVAAVADGGSRAGLVGDLAVAAAKHQDLHQLVEHDPVGDASPVAAKGMVGVVGAAVGQQRTELVP